MTPVSGISARSCDDCGREGDWVVGENKFGKLSLRSDCSDCLLKDEALSNRDVAAEEVRLEPVP